MSEWSSFREMLRHGEPKEPQPHVPPDEPMNCKATLTSSILAEADAIAGEDRSRDYGHPLANHRRIAEIWNTLLEKKLSAELTPSDVAVMMIGLKLARLINSPSHRDSMTDIAGYVKCWDMIQEAGGE